MGTLTEVAAGLPTACVSATKISAPGCGVGVIDGQGNEVRIMVLTGNRVRTLDGVEGYPNLRALRLDANLVHSVSELRKLRHLPHLKNLWLSACPVARDYEYRAAVVKTLNAHSNPIWAVSFRLDGTLVTPEDVADARNVSVLQAHYFPLLLWLQRVREAVQADVAMARPYAKWHHRSPVKKVPQGGPCRVTALLEDMFACFAQPDASERVVLSKVESGADALDTSEVVVDLPCPGSFSAHDLRALQKRVHTYVSESASLRHLTISSGTDILHTLDPHALCLLAGMLRNAALALCSAVEHRAACALSAQPSKVDTNVTTAESLQSLVREQAAAQANIAPRRTPSPAASTARLPSTRVDYHSAASSSGRVGTSQSRSPSPIVFNLKRDQQRQRRSVSHAQRAGLYHIQKLPAGGEDDCDDAAVSEADAFEESEREELPEAGQGGGGEGPKVKEVQEPRVPLYATSSTVAYSATPSPPRPRLSGCSRMTVTPVGSDPHETHPTPSPKMEPEPIPLPSVAPYKRAELFEQESSTQSAVAEPNPVALFEVSHTSTEGKKDSQRAGVRKHHTASRCGLLSTFWELMHRCADLEHYDLGMLRNTVADAISIGLKSEACTSADMIEAVLQSEDEALFASLLWWRHRPQKKATESTDVQTLECNVVQSYRALRKHMKCDTIALVIETELCSLRNVLYDVTAPTDVSELQVLVLRTMDRKMQALCKATPYRRKKRSHDTSRDTTLVAMLHNLDTAAERKAAKSRSRNRKRLLMLHDAFTRWKWCWSRALVSRVARR